MQSHQQNQIVFKNYAWLFSVRRISTEIFNWEPPPQISAIPKMKDEPFPAIFLKQTLLTHVTCLFPPLIKDVFIQHLHLHNIERFFFFSPVNLAHVSFFSAKALVLCWYGSLLCIDCSALEKCKRVSLLKWFICGISSHFFSFSFFAINTAQWFPALIRGVIA